MTEQEASAKICPFMSGPTIVPGQEHTGTATVTVTHWTYCVAYQCMAWEGVVGKEVLEGYCKKLEVNNESIY